MSNKNSSNLISLMSCFDDICDKAIEAVSNSLTTSNYHITTTGNTISDSGGYYIGDPLPYNPFREIHNFKRWNDFSWWTTPIIYKIETPSYPVSNYSVTKDGTSIIEIAVSGFDSDELTVKREDLKIIVIGSTKDREDDSQVKKYIYKHVAERDFQLEYLGSEKWNFDKLSVKLSKGILSISIPIKEECKPVNKVYKIDK